MKTSHLFFLSVFGCIVKLSVLKEVSQQGGLKCHLHDDDCILKSANEILKKYKEGIKHLNLTSIDPFRTEPINFARDTGPVSIDAKFKEMIIKGLSTAQFKKFKGFNRNLLEISLSTPSLIFSGPYQSKAQILYVPFDNSGDFLVRMIKMKFGMKFGLERQKRSDKEFFNVINSTVVWDADDFDIIEPDLGYIINTFLKSTYGLIKSTLGGEVAEFGGMVFKQKLNEVLNGNSIDDLFLN